MSNFYDVLILAMFPAVATAFFFVGRISGYQQARAQRRNPK